MRKKKHILNPFLRRGTWILWPLFPFRYYVIADTWRLEQEALTFLSELITAAWQPLCKTIRRTTQQHMYGNARVQYVSDDVDVAGPNSAFRNSWCQFKVCFLMNPRCLLCTLVRFIKTEEFLFFPVDLFGVFRDFWHSKLKTTASNPPDLTLKCGTILPDPDMAVSFWRGQAQTWLESPHRTEVWHSFFRTLFCAWFDFQTPQKKNPIIATFPLCNNRRFIQKIMERVCTYCIFPATSVNVKEPPSHLSETQTNTFTPRLFLVYSFNQLFLLKFKQQHLFLLEAKTSDECQKRRKRDFRFSTENSCHVIFTVDILQ